MYIYIYIYMYIINKDQLTITLVSDSVYIFIIIHIYLYRVHLCTSSEEWCTRVEYTCVLAWCTPVLYSPRLHSNHSDMKSLYSKHFVERNWADYPTLVSTPFIRSLIQRYTRPVTRSLTHSLTNTLMWMCVRVILVNRERDRQVDLWMKNRQRDR